MSRIAFLATCVLLLASTARGATLRVTSARDAGKGTLREAITAANGAPGSSIRISLPADSVIVVEGALPALEARGTRLDGGGVTLRESPGCERPRGKKGCDGLVVAGTGIVVRNVRIAGFMFDGVSVRGPQARNVRIERVQAVDNLDDGVGVSDHAGPVTVSNCLLMGNGFRTKGKGLLVFDHSTATLRDSVVLANRDGVTVTDGSSAKLENVIVAVSYDKGVGVSGAALTGRAVAVLANGHDPQQTSPPPNGDGLRVGLGGRARLSRSRIAGSGDSGVVVLDNSTVSLRDCIVEANRGEQTVISPSGHFTQR